MRRAVPLLAFVAIALLALAPLACGGSDDTREQLSAEEYEELVGPEIVPPQGPPPKRLVIKDLELGSGPVARRGDQVGVNYVGVFYKTGEKLGRRWLSHPPVVFPLGFASYGKGFEKGVEGMRPGGQRELIIPSHLTSGPEALVYVIALVSVEPAAQSSRSS
ncbi:MAG TPA: FKBP-type peptidyl-prolyl cis-trans isomerase [Solirubrobacterales bacterium]